MTNNELQVEIILSKNNGESFTINKSIKISEIFMKNILEECAIYVNNDSSSSAISSVSINMKFLNIEYNEHFRLLDIYDMFYSDYINTDGFKLSSRCFIDYNIERVFSNNIFEALSNSMFHQYPESDYDVYNTESISVRVVDFYNNYRLGKIRSFINVIRNNPELYDLKSGTLGIFNKKYIKYDVIPNHYIELYTDKDGYTHMFTRSISDAELDYPDLEFYRFTNYYNDEYEYFFNRSDIISEDRHLWNTYLRNNTNIIKDEFVYKHYKCLECGHLNEIDIANVNIQDKSGYFVKIKYASSFLKGRFYGYDGEPSDKTNSKATHYLELLFGDITEESEYYLSEDCTFFIDKEYKSLLFSLLMIGDDVDNKYSLDINKLGGNIVNTIKNVLPNIFKGRGYGELAIFRLIYLDILIKTININEINELILSLAKYSFDEYYRIHIQDVVFNDIFVKRIVTLKPEGITLISKYSDMVIEEDNYKLINVTDDAIINVNNIVIDDIVIESVDSNSSKQLDLSMDEKEIMDSIFK